MSGRVADVMRWKRRDSIPPGELSSSPWCPKPLSVSKNIRARKEWARRRTGDRKSRGPEVGRREAMRRPRGKVTSQGRISS